MENNKPSWQQVIQNEIERKTGKLHLGSRDLPAIPKEVSQMTWLTELNLSNNQLNKIEGLENLRSLQVLRLDNNQIIKIDGLERLVELRRLDLSNNLISQIQGFVPLVNLEELNIDFNQIPRIEGLEELVQLDKLSLVGNSINEIEGLDELGKLRILDLDANKLCKIEGLSNLKQLEELRLNNNQIVSLSGLQDVPSLRVLLLRRNKITVLNGIEHLVDLYDLDLSENRVERVDILVHNKSLTILELSGNMIHDISPLASNVFMEQFYLNHNPIKNIDILSKMTKLTKVVLFKTNIETLLPLLPIIEKGISVKMVNVFVGDTMGVYLKNNDSLDIPLEIIEQGNTAILDFYKLKFKKSRNPDEEIFLYEAKLIIVGEGKVGKSSLRVKLMNPDASLPKDEDRTRGIDIQDYHFLIDQVENFKAHIWDFGGQNILYALHRFFMTENSLYILMTESRTERDKNFDYWFQNIELFGGHKSPVIVVMNLTHGERGANIDIASYTSAFSNIKYAQIQEVNLMAPEPNHGLKNIRRIIEQELQMLPHVQKPVFKCWLDVRNALQEEMKTYPYISLQRFHEICKKSDVDSPYYELLGRYLHNLGIVLWYHDKEFLKNMMILNPLWAISAIYKIIDDKAIQDRKGIFDDADKIRLWSDTSYRYAMDELTSLLKVFKICFQRQNSTDYLVPALMEASKPSIALEWDGIDAKKVRFEYRFMPKGIVNQLAADMNKYIQDEINHVWAYGLVLHLDGDPETAACITENTYGRFIQIEVKGMYENRFMGIIIEALKTINESYKELESNLKITCICKICKQHSAPHQFSESDLIEKIRESKTQVYCNRLDDKINIAPILESIGISYPSYESFKVAWHGESNYMADEKKKRKIFISYAHAQKAYISIFTNDFRQYLVSPENEFEIFDDHEIPLGSKWDIYLQNKVNDCDIMILLVSQEFINSEYIQQQEFGAALKKLENSRNVLIVPVYFAPCNFRDKQDLSVLQFFKPDGVEYDEPQLGDNFSYIDLVKFNKKDGMPLINSYRKHYMLAFVKKLKTLLHQA